MSEQIMCKCSTNLTRQIYIVTGKNACPPENSGGTVGYKELLKTIRNPGHKEHDQMKKWLAECGYPANFDPKHFSPSEVKFEATY